MGCNFTQVINHYFQNTMTTPGRIDITIAGKPYNISTASMPYFASYTDFQKKAGHTLYEHGEVPLFEAAYRGVEEGFRHCFRSLDTDLSEYHTLCDTLDFLGVDIFGGRSIDTVIEDLKEGKGRYEVDYKRPVFVTGDKSTARDSAFRLLYVILRGELEDNVATSQKFYNAVLFVVSHRAIFKYRARRTLRAAYEERFSVSKKQMANLDRWPISTPNSFERSNDDVTSEESDFLSDSYDDD